LHNFPNPEISQFNLSNLEGISVIAQLSNTLKWLHDNKILHNDIKSDNVLVAKDNGQFHAILIDFGKACVFAYARRKELSEELKAEYREKHAHFAPEIIEGKSKQSPAISDV
jgi:serine/threonine protein kinase